MERVGDIEQVVRRMYESMRAADSESVGAMVAHDPVVFVGTDAEDWEDEVESLRRVLREQLEAANGFDIFGEDPVGYAYGDVGWYSDRPSMRLPDGSVVPLRHTGVLRRTDGEWRFVQSHLSVPANVNETLFGGT